MHVIYSFVKSNLQISLIVVHIVCFNRKPVSTYSNEIVVDL